MPRDGKKGRRKRQLLNSSDVSLQDFANCSMPQSCSRIRKSVAQDAATGASAKMSAQSLVEKDTEDLSWFEKDLEDFVIKDSIPDEDEEEEDLAVGGEKHICKKESPRDDNKAGFIFPVDLWYLLSDHIDPTDISRFARLCRGAHSIVQTSAFWRKLYLRFSANGKEGLPSQLRPHRMEKLHGLRARVIRSLFYLHPTLSARVQSKGPMEDEPHDLKGHRCLLAWHQPAPKGWQFCFKFQKPSLKALSSRPASKQDVYNGYNDMFYNPEEGCSVLQVTCCHFSSVAAVMGLLLNQVYLTLSSGFRHHRLRLHFDSRVSSSLNAASDMVVVLDDVLAVKVMQWWHPGYPFTS